ncbi:MAG: class I SAM-dependent methyltransferase [Proteobacteria bacterium]|nr:class I SAM-dependent methyltransferase [Pseudomonadota bacterium]
MEIKELVEEKQRLPSSFRDPNGFVIRSASSKTIQRVIFPSYFHQYLHLLESGLYSRLVEEKALVSHELIKQSNNKIIIEPQNISLITYSYEWPFHLLKDSALLTLKITKIALEYGMILKDATSYNIQLKDGKPIFIDTLSFDFYKEGDLWGAYGQFCRHFLAPLLCMKYTDLNFSKILAGFIDGIPIELISKLLPLSTHFSPFIASNIHLHAKKLKKYNLPSNEVMAAGLSKKKLLHILNYMELFISSLNYSRYKTEWGDYYNNTNYSEHAFDAKNQIVSSYIASIDAKTIWDAGGNNGHFSRLIAKKKKLIISTDIDPIAVDQNYIINKQNNINSIVPLIIDLTNPSPAIGFANRERNSFFERIVEKKLDCILALALIHHLCLSNNCTFSMVLNYFKQMANFLIIEFIPAEDSWAKELLDRKREFKYLFDFYNQNAFEKSCTEFFEIIKKEQLAGSLRTIYLLKTKSMGH